MHLRIALSFMISALLLLPVSLRAQELSGDQAAAASGFSPTQEVVLKSDPPGVTDVQAPTAPGPVAPVILDLRSANFIDVGVRGTSFGSGSDQARFERYRDLRNGPTLDAFRYTNETDGRQFTAQGGHVGYRDQQYSASYNRYGKVKASFEWNQTPLFYSQDTATLFTSAAPGVLRLDDAIQTGLQNRTTTLAGVVGQAQPFDLRTRRDVFDVKLTYSPIASVDWNLAIRNTTKNGSQPWAGTFGFSDAVELAVPVDTRTTEVGTAFEWSGPRGLARVGYDGSFFRNHISTLTWDNPLRVTDSPTAGPLQGRMALWPNSNMNTASASGLVNLPARSRATAYISVGNWSQDDPLIPFTINSALPTVSLDRATADVQARVTAMTYAFTSKPANPVWISVRYRSYDFDNRTPVFQVGNTVAYDTSVAAFAEGGTSPYSFTRRTFDADASFTPLRHAAFRAGYTREQLNQTFRFVDTTTEDTLRFSADVTGLTWLTLRALYEHAKRVGSGFDDQALDDIGEQVSLRQFDISDRNSDRVSAIVQVMPTSAWSFNGSVSVGKEDRPGAVFGLRSNDNHAYSVGFDFVPRDAVSLGLSYEYEKYDTLQASRQANPGIQFNDPTRDWTTDGGDKARTFTASLDLLKLWPKTDVRVAYNFSHAESLYVYGLAPNSTLPPVTQLPAVVNELQRGTVDVRYYLTAHLAAGGAYWYDSYRVNDFALGQETLTTLAQPSFLMMGYLYRPYTANTVMGRLTFLW
jgi:MtrB/PioB family decaheme-associated outer membrane protein